MVNSEHEWDWTSREEEPSMKDMFQSLTAMMASLNTRMEQIDGGGRKKGNVAFCSGTPWLKYFGDRSLTKAAPILWNKSPFRNMKIF